MDFGLHFSGQRPDRVPADAWADDLFELVAADRLGFHEAWIREHGGATGPMPVPDTFIGKAAGLTTRIRMGPERHLTYHHPVQVATDAGVADHLLGGRYMLGFSTGLGPGSTEMIQRGYAANAVKAECVLEAIALIQRCWQTEEPFDFDGEFWHGQQIHVTPRPLQQPHMPLAINASSYPRYTELGGAQGFMPLFFDYNGPKAIAALAELYIRAAVGAGRPPDRHPIRVCRFIYVAESDAQARAELRASIEPHIDYDRRLLQHHFKETVPPSGRYEDITFDYLVDADYYFVGSPATVERQIRTLYDQIGGFGTLLFRMGTDRGTSEGRANSMRLFMEHVAPRLADLEPAVPDQ